MFDITSHRFWIEHTYCHLCVQEVVTQTVQPLWYAEKSFICKLTQWMTDEGFEQTDLINWWNIRLFHVQNWDWKTCIRMYELFLFSKCYDPLLSKELVALIHPMMKYSSCSYCTDNYLLLDHYFRNKTKTADCWSLHFIQWCGFGFGQNIGDFYIPQNKYTDSFKAFFFVSYFWC